MDIKRVIRILSDPKGILVKLNYNYPLLFSWMPDEMNLKFWYRYNFGKKLNLDNPETFNEKLQWLKLNNRKDEYTRMVDKYEVKEYVASIVGDQFIIPTLGVWDSFDEIDFDALPKQFVLKCTHDSGGLVICKDKSKLDLKAAKKKIQKSLKRSYYWVGREWPYKNVKPRIIAEAYMQDSKTNDLKDYKFFCFGGVAKCFKVDFDRYIEHHANYYDMQRNLLDFGEAAYPPNDKKKLDINPETLEEMQRLAEKLSADIPFLRADFYDVDGRIYFGELTFYPASGFGKFTSEQSDQLMGKWISIRGGGNAPAR